MKPAAHNMSQHICNLVTPGGTPHVGGNIIATQSKVFIEGKPAIVQNNVCNCSGGGPQSVTGGSVKVKIQGQGMVGGNDQTAHSGLVNPITCSKKVLIN